MVFAFLCRPFLFVRMSGEPAKRVRNWASVLRLAILASESESPARRGVVRALSLAGFARQL